MLNEIEIPTAIALLIFGGIFVIGLALSVATIVAASLENAARREYKRRRL